MAGKVSICRKQKTVLPCQDVRISLPMKGIGFVTLTAVHAKRDWIGLHAAVISRRTLRKLRAEAIAGWREIAVA